VKHDERSFVVADIPGLVPGAHEGRGLGDRFLRHVRRAAVLLFLIDLAAEDRDPASDLEVLEAELHAFDEELAERPKLVVATKADVAGDRIGGVTDVLGDVHAISAVTGEGIDALVGRLADAVAGARESAPARVGYVRHVVREEPLSVHKEDHAWRVTGLRAERAVATTDIDNEEALARLQRRLISMGVERLLTASGARRGDEVRIADNAFEFEPEGEADDEAAPRT
jgi:GTP-binding protein